MLGDQAELDLFGEEPVDDPGNPTLGVIEFAEVLNGVLKRSFSEGVWLRGEIEGFAVRRGHTYFNLVERDGDRQGSLAVSLFRGRQLRLEPLLQKHGLRLADGLSVRVFGIPDFFAPFGRVSLVMSDIDPRFTLGDLAAGRAQLLARLERDGLLTANKQHPMPLVPLRIGLVTSRNTAAWHDFRDELTSSGFGFELTVRDTPVQGIGADASVAEAISSMANEDIDVVVVVRGGGARNDLAVFDSELIARAIATSPIPVVTGIGHEIDRSVSDDVAHTSVKTPTAAAALLVEYVADFQGRTEAVWGAIHQRAESIIAGANERVDLVARRVAQQTYAAIARSDERLSTRRLRLGTAARRHLDWAEHRLASRATTVSSAPSKRLDLCSEALARATSRLAVVAERGVGAATSNLDAIEARVQAADPVHLLRRGWTITRDARGGLVRSIDDVASGEVLTTTVADGVVTSQIASVATTRDHHDPEELSTS